MRIYIALIFTLFLAACNGSSDNDSAYATTAQLPPNEATQVADLQAQVLNLQKKMGSLQIIGKTPHKTGASVEDFRAMGEPNSVASVSFGPCANMGVLLGRGDNSDSQDPLSAPIESFQQCTGYEYSVTVSTSTVAQGPRLFWDGPGCTGNMYEWNSGGGSYNDQTLEGGVVFLSPMDSSPLMVKSGQTPQPILIQSVWVLSNPGCQSDIETQSLYQVTPNDIAVSGVPNGSVGSFQLTSP